ncbi:AMP-binding protein [Actinoplanes nipponensis]|uniref:AMP-binding protein n=1 Tax=Actinoplanes nipponensis TaxID=135950 RepID=UPI001EF32F0A|nr:AMP-binding protein [Actinoplanes nipponensis]
MENSARDPVRTSARDRPAAPALIAEDTVVTWAELDERVTRAAGRLVTGTRPGDRVALVLGNTVDFAVAYFATLRAGLVAVPLNPGYTADELTFALTDSGAARVVAEDAVLGRLRLAEGVAVRVPELRSGEPGAPHPAAAEDLAVLLYTSGTSGRPKGAMLTHRALAANHDQLALIEPPVLDGADVVLLTIPFFHAYGLNTGLGAIAHHGACGVLVDRFTPGPSLDLIAKHQVTAVIGVPSMYAAWSREPAVRERMASVRTAVCGAAPLDPADAARFTAATGRTVLIGYGLTETAPVLTTTAVSDRQKTGSIGRPLPGVSLLLRTAGGEVLWRDGPVADEPDDAELELDLEVGAGTDPGEIVVRGANLFSGYWPDGRDGPDADGWWGTADIAYADADGDLVLVDRIGELILVNGFNVYPAEIERVLVAHPGVAEAAVTAVPDEATGQAPYAYVVSAADPPPTAAELLAHCAAQLARFKLPAGIELVAELPRSAIGKVRKGAL